MRGERTEFLLRRSEEGQKNFQSKGKIAGWQFLFFHLKGGDVLTGSTITRSKFLIGSLGHTNYYLCFALP